jgi:alkylation response protein AidB-like acyl-CoA dehydrogenase
MDVRLDDQHILVQQTAARVAADHALTVAPTERGPAGDGRLWRAMCDTGFVALHAPESAGGGGASAIDVSLVAEQLGQHLCAAPFIGQAVLAPELLAHAGRSDIVTGIASGDTRVAVALDPTLGGLARAGANAIAWDAAGATHALFADDTDRLWWAAIGGDELPVLDLTRTARMFDTNSGSAECLGDIPLDSGVCARVDALAYTVIAADLVGVMQSAVDAAVSYVRDRVQFGVPVGSFQAVQHLAADAAVLLEGSRSSMWHAAWAADELDAFAAVVAARQAKAYCSRAAQQVVEMSVQLHGGIAITWEHLAHVRQRRALFLAASFGDERAHLRAIADAQLGSEAATVGA